MTLKYTDDHKALCALARAKGLSNRQILEALTANEFGVAAKKKVILKFAAELHMTKAEAIEVAVKAGIIPQ